MPKHDFLSPHLTGRAGLPHPALAETLASSMHRWSTLRSQRDQTQMLHLSVNRRTFGRPVGTLAVAPQMFPQAPLHVAVDLAESVARITIAKVAGPAFQVTIQLPDQLRKRDAILLRTGHLAQLRPLPRQVFIPKSSFALNPGKLSTDRTVLNAFNSSWCNRYFSPCTQSSRTTAVVCRPSEGCK
jgi:hypothetical protein